MQRDSPLTESSPQLQEAISSPVIVLLSRLELIVFPLNVINPFSPYVYISSTLYTPRVIPGSAFIPRKAVEARAGGGREPIKFDTRTPEIFPFTRVRGVFLSGDSLLYAQHVVIDLLKISGFVRGRSCSYGLFSPPFPSFSSALSLIYLALSLISLYSLFYFLFSISVSFLSHFLLLSPPAPLSCFLSFSSLLSLLSPLLSLSCSSYSFSCRYNSKRIGTHSERGALHSRKISDHRIFPSLFTVLSSLRFPRPTPRGRGNMCFICFLHSRFKACCTNFGCSGITDV